MRPSKSTLFEKVTASTNDEQGSSQELFLLRMRYKEGRLVEAGANAPFLLNDPDYAWLVYAGKVDVFIVAIQEGRPAGPRYHLMRVEAGQAAFGMTLSSHLLGLMVVGVADTKLLKIKVSRLRELAKRPTDAPGVIALLENWIGAISQALTRGVPPKDCQQLALGQTLTLAENAVVTPIKGVLWVRDEAGGLAFLGEPDYPLHFTPLSSHFTPLYKSTWLRALQPMTLTALSTAQWLQQDPNWGSLQSFHALVLDVLMAKVALVIESGRQRWHQRADADEVAIQTALGELASILEPEQLFVPHTDTSDEALFVACQLVGQALELEMRPASPSQRTRDPLGDIARASGVRVRPVLLSGAWWQTDNGPLVAYRLSDHEPVALLQTESRRYKIVDPTTSTQTPLTPTLAATIDPGAYMFYRSLPARPLGWIDLARFGLSFNQRDVVTLVALHALAAGLALLVPLAIGILFDRVIPAAELSQLWQVTLGLGVAALAGAIFQGAQNITQLRLEGRVGAEIQAAFWSRLLALPASFFRQYSSGDLATRAFAINLARQTLTGPVLSTVLSGVFAFFSFCLLFYYDLRLALLATLLLSSTVVLTLTIGYRQLRLQRRILEWEGIISGRLVQFITGITKLRVAGADGRAFALWANAFAEQKMLTYQLRGLSNTLTVLNAAFPFFASLTLFALVASLGNSFTAGVFLAFNAAFGQLQSSVLTLSATFVSILSLLPAFERARPILQALPEADAARADPGELQGDIEISHVSFRYKSDGPRVLQDVSIRARRGEFIAIVGPSGSGKSTLFRLLLGFEKPESGAVYYDGQDLAGLDVRSVRQQVGVVLQNSRLMPGSIFTNIVGALPFTLDDAWEAARAAGIAADIERLPMGMQTIVTEGGSTFSGGQRQRLLIANALISRPRVVLFDESTSALDNQAQTVVGQSLERLQATRFIIAHRLSTIVRADWIYVIVGGHIAQRGTYSELVNQPGPFAELVKRQLG